MISVDHLPVFIRRRLSGRDTLLRALNNSAWLFCDQALRMLAGLVVGVWIARYLGPERYGWLSYALSAVGLVSSFTSLGINPVVVRELARDGSASAAWLRTALGLKSLGAALGYCACVAVAWFRAVPADEVRALIVVVGLGMLFQVFDAIDLLFQAHGEPRTSAWVRMISCVVANVVKVGLILARAPLMAFAAAGVFEIALNAIGWATAARYRGIAIRLLPWDTPRGKALLRESFPLALSSLAIYAQAYSDQLVLGSMLGGAALGQYAAAIRLVTVFAFVPTIVYTVSAPEITRAKRDDEALYWRRLHRLYRAMFGLFLTTGLPLALLGPIVMRVLYGAAYDQAATLLPWLALRLLFTNFGTARAVFITNEGLFRFAFFTAVAGAVVNIALNLLLVPRWHAHGAIAASLVSFAVTTFAFEWMNRRARLNLVLMGRAVLLPWQGAAP
jgi:O-antigen/teichoic acid export membrane protein